MQPKYVVYLHDCEAPVPESIGEGATENDAAINAWKAIRCDSGPLAEEPRCFADFADAVADAYGGEACVTVELE